MFQYFTVYCHGGTLIFSRNSECHRPKITISGRAPRTCQSILTRTREGGASKDKVEWPPRSGIEAEVRKIDHFWNVANAHTGLDGGEETSQVPSVN